MLCSEERWRFSDLNLRPWSQNVYLRSERNPMDRALGRADETGQVTIIDQPAVAPLQFGVNRDLPAAMPNSDGLRAHRHTDLLADQPPGHRIGVAVDLNRAIGPRRGATAPAPW